MITYDVVAYVNDASVYCPECAHDVCGVDDDHEDPAWAPLFPDHEFDAYPNCDRCGALIEQVSLTSYPCDTCGKCGPHLNATGQTRCLACAGMLGATLRAAREACLSCVVRDVVDACERAITKGAILHAHDHFGDVTAGNGMVVDWRVIKGGDVVVEGASPRHVAETLIRVAHPDALTKALLRLDP